MNLPGVNYFGRLTTTILAAAEITRNGVYHPWHYLKLLGVVMPGKKEEAESRAL